MSEEPKVIDFRCQTCKAQPGEPCVVKRQPEYGREFHLARQDRARGPRMKWQFEKHEAALARKWAAEDARAVTRLRPFNEILAEDTAA